MISAAITTAIARRNNALVAKKQVGPEPCQIEYVSDKSPDTACWSFGGDGHLIKINHDCDKNADAKLITKERTRQTFFVKVFEHERCHGEWTPRDMPALHKQLADAGIPFMLWNLFEDARIEHRWRSKRGKFQWMKTQGLTGSPWPTSLFLDLKNMEGQKKLVADFARSRESDPPTVKWESIETEPAQPARKFVLEYFRRAVRAKSSDALIPIMQSWMKTFPDTASWPLPRWFMADYVEVDSASAEDGGEDRPTADQPAGPDETPLVLAKSKYLREEKTMELDRARGNSLVRLFERWLRGGEERVFTATPTSRINMRRFVEGKQKFYSRRADTATGVKQAVIIYDTSGSMYSVHPEGAYLLYVLNELVRKGLLRCRELILSGGKPLAIPMPFDPRIIEHIYCCGRIEGFAPAMQQYQSDLVAADLTLFFTDGAIVDAPIDKAAWHERGVYSVGMFVLNDKPEVVSAWSDRMLRYFDSVLVRGSIEGIADSLVQLLKPERR